jgi:hypothetical protein
VRHTWNIELSRPEAKRPIEVYEYIEEDNNGI